MPSSRHLRANAAVVAAGNATVVVLDGPGESAMREPVQRSAGRGEKYEGRKALARAGMKKRQERVMGCNSSRGGRSGLEGVGTMGLMCVESLGAWSPARNALWKSGAEDPSLSAWWKMKEAENVEGDEGDEAITRRQ